MRNNSKKTKLYGGISQNSEPFINPVQVTESDIVGKSKPNLKQIMSDKWNKAKIAFGMAQPYIDVASRVINAPRDTLVNPINQQAKRAIEDTATVYDNLPDDLQRNAFVRFAKGGVDRVNNAVALFSTPSYDIPQTVSDIATGAYQGVKEFSKDPVGNIANYYTNEYNDPLIPMDIFGGAAGVAEGVGSLAKAGSIAKSISKAPIKNKTNVLTNMNELPKQSPIARATDANPVVGEVKSFEQIAKENPKPKTTNNIAKNNIAEDAEILSEGEIDKLQRKRLTARAEEYAKAQDAIMQSLEEKFGGRENLDNYLDAISSNMTPEEYNQWKTAYLAHQKGVLFGGNPADVLADISIKTKIDPRLPFEGDVGRYNTETGNIKLAPDTFINKYNRPFEGSFEKDSNINALHHEMTHDLNLQAELADAFNKAEGTGIFSKEAELYNQRHGNPTVGNESASFGFESTNLDNQPLKQGLIDEYYKRGGYEHNLSNPEMLNQRNLYKQGISRFKTLMESGMLKGDDLRILNEQNLMRKFDPNYQSPLDTMNLKTFDQIRNAGRLQW